MDSNTATRDGWMRAAHRVKRDRLALSGPRPRGADSPRSCRSCPVQPTCLGWALIIGADNGVLGGLEPGYRRGLRVQRQQRLGDRPMAGSGELADIVRTCSQPSFHTAGKCRPDHGAEPTR